MIIYYSNYKQATEKEKKEMARKPMVTRTIVTSKVNVLCLDINTCEPFNTDIVLPRTYVTEEKLLKAVKEVVNNENVKAVHVVDVKKVETLYGMDEQTFINNAIILDNETRKPVDTTEAAE